MHTIQCVPPSYQAGHESTWVCFSCHLIPFPSTNSVEDGHTIDETSDAEEQLPTQDLADPIPTNDLEVRVDGIDETMDAEELPTDGDLDSLEIGMLSSSSSPPTSEINIDVSFPLHLYVQHFHYFCLRFLICPTFAKHSSFCLTSHLFFNIFLFLLHYFIIPIQLLI